MRYYNTLLLPNYLKDIQKNLSLMDPHLVHLRYNKPNFGIRLLCWYWTNVVNTNVEKKNFFMYWWELYLLPLKKENEMPFFMTPSQSVFMTTRQIYRIFLTKSFFGNIFFFCITVSNKHGAQKRWKRMLIAFKCNLFKNTISNPNFTSGQKTVRQRIIEWKECTRKQSWPNFK